MFIDIVFNTAKSKLFKELCTYNMEYCYKIDVIHYNYYYNGTNDNGQINYYFWF